VLCTCRASADQMSAGSDMRAADTFAMRIGRISAFFLSPLLQYGRPRIPIRGHMLTCFANFQKIRRRFYCSLKQKYRNFACLSLFRRLASTVRSVGIRFCSSPGPSLCRAVVRTPGSSDRCRKRITSCLSKTPSSTRRCPAARRHSFPALLPICD
jgi:hypothetical protein